MKHTIVLTAVLVLMAFIMGFFTKDIFEAVINVTNNNEGASCTYGKLVYRSGEGFKSNDGCNSCSCENGQVMCTAMACQNENDTNITFPEQITSCNYNGNNYANGSSFMSPDACFNCVCTNGSISCKETPLCNKTNPTVSTSECTFQGKIYKDGSSFPSGDGCNTCGCSGGQVNCTLRACAQ